MVYKSKCMVCGKIVAGDRRRKTCSKLCYNKLYRKKADTVEVENSCMFNDGVVCDRMNCEHCGWNPDVEAKRKEAR